MGMNDTTSGATVYTAGPTTVKTILQAGPAQDRLLEQAWFLASHASPALPIVTSISDVSYTMETLRHLPWQVVSPMLMANNIFDLLNRHVWQPAPATVDWSTRTQLRVDRHLDGAHFEYVKQRAYRYAPKLLPWFEKKFEILADLDVYEIHGDPTFDNVMLRGDDELVLIDPIPATPKMPGHRESDIGKIVQSMFGYEWIRHLEGVEPRPFRYRATSTEILGFITSIHPTKFSREAIVYYTALHFVRLIPYQPTARLSKLFQEVAEGIPEVLE